MCQFALLLSNLYSLGLDSLYVQVGMDPTDGEYDIRVKMDNFHQIENGESMIQSVCFNIEEFQQLRDICFTDCNIQYEVGTYTVVYSPDDNILFFKLFEDLTPIFQVPLNEWVQFSNRFNVAINYQIAFLQKYRDYARLIHSRIVNYYSIWLNENDVSLFTIDFLKHDIVLLDSSSLPKQCNVTCDYSRLDYNVCYLIDSEVRLNSVPAIYVQSLILSLE